MTLAFWALVAEIVGSLAVVGSLIYVAIQVRQSNALFGLQVSATSMDQQISLIDIVLQDPELVTLMMKDPALLSEMEKGRLLLLGLRACVGFETVYTDMKAGIRSEGQVVQALRAVFHRPKLNYGLPVAWETYKIRTNDEFIHWMEKKVIDPGLP